MSHSEVDGLKDRKRRATSVRIAASAARLAAEQGLAATTVDQIADDAQVGRATFFRYYQSKENAVAEGITGPWLTLITDAIAGQPAQLSAMDAIVTAFTELAERLPVHYRQIRELAALTRTSTCLDAWTLRTYHRYESAIAALAAGRITDLTDADPRPRMVAALSMAAIRIALDDWIRQGGSLPALTHRALRSVTVSGSTPDDAGPRPPRSRQPPKNQPPRRPHG